MRLALLAVLVLAASGVAAQPTVYRWVDPSGQTVYSDQPPPPGAKSVQQKKLGGSYIEVDKTPYSNQVAQQRSPVTLWAGPCGELCDEARALLNRRGIPFREVDPAAPGEMENLRKLVGEPRVPVLQVGGAAALRGIDEARWHAALDAAGYAKAPIRPLGPAAAPARAEQAAPASRKEPQGGEPAPQAGEPAPQGGEPVPQGNLPPKN